MALVKRWHHFIKGNLKLLEVDTDITTLKNQQMSQAVNSQ